MGVGTPGWEPGGCLSSHSIPRPLCDLEQILCPLGASVSPSVKRQSWLGLFLRALPALKVSELLEWVTLRCPLGSLPSLPPSHKAGEHRNVEEGVFASDT